MTPHRLMLTYLSGNMPFRPRWIAEEFVFRAALKSPLRAAQITAAFADHNPITAGGFVRSFESYVLNPDMWRIHRIGEVERQRAIDECRRGPGGLILGGSFSGACAA